MWSRKTSFLKQTAAASGVRCCFFSLLFFNPFLHLFSINPPFLPPPYQPDRFLPAKRMPATVSLPRLVGRFEGGSCRARGGGREQ